MSIAFAEMNATANIGSGVGMGERDGVKANTDVNANLRLRAGGGMMPPQTLINARTHGEEAIDRRIDDLQRLDDRIAEMKHVDDSTKAGLSTSLSAEIQKLKDLKVKISGDTDATVLRGDEKQITENNRVYLVVKPQASILVATDRVTNIVAMLTALVPKLQARITVAQTAGKDVTALNTALVDLQAKIADATTVSTSATASVTGLTADNGDTTIKASNETAVKSARAGVQTANKDLMMANKDIKTIMMGIRGVGTEAKVHTSADESTGVQTN
jgi:hypothetical protein